MMSQDFDDYTRPVEAVVRQERDDAMVRSVPLKAADRRWLFERWCELNPQAMAEIEQTACSIDARGKRVSAKYLIEKQRYEGSYKLIGVPFTDQLGEEHVYAINNSDSALISRWLLERHPGMRVEIRHSMFDEEEP